MIKPRNFNGYWQDVPPVWIPQQQFACSVLNVTHLVLPPGELWFCRLFNQALPLIRDHDLREQVKGFVAQEGAHARGHRDVLSFYESQGWNFSVSKQRLNKIFGTLLGDKVLGRFAVKSKGQLRWLRMRIGMVAAIEHVTCVLGSWILENETLRQAGANQAMLNLLLWHGAEEVEHRTVAFDLYRHLGGGNVGRMFWFLLAVWAVVLTWKRGTQVFIEQSPGEGDVREKPRYGFRAYVAASRAGYLPTVGYLVRSFLRYLRWSYHPGTEGNPQRAEAVLNGMEVGQYQSAHLPVQLNVDKPTISV